MSVHRGPARPDEAIRSARQCAASAASIFAVVHTGRPGGSEAAAPRPTASRPQLSQQRLANPISWSWPPPLPRWQRPGARPVLPPGKPAAIAKIA